MRAEHNSDRWTAVSVIVPAYNAAATIGQCLAPLLKMCHEGEISEVIVVDDGSTDDTADIAKAAGALTLSSGGRLGPGGARNVAASIAHGDVLWFVDADAVAHEDAARVLMATLSESGVSAVFGAYDDRPTANGFWSQYKNLVHHHYHRNSKREAETFWAGCGAVRKTAFLAVGGFDAANYPRPSIEDIELGWRLRQHGCRILLVPEFQVTHLKIWRLPNLLRTEILSRALPWSRLINSRTGWVDTLNVSRSERIRALVALGFLASLPVAFLPSWVSIVLLIAAIAANRRLGTLFYRRRGLAFAGGAMLFHQIYYLYCSGAVAWSWAERLWSPGNGPTRDLPRSVRSPDPDQFQAGRRATWLAAVDE